MFETLPRGGDGWADVRTGSSMVTDTPDFCWLMERRTTLSLGVTEGNRRKAGEEWEEGLAKMYKSTAWGVMKSKSGKKICTQQFKSIKKPQTFQEGALPFVASTSSLTDVCVSKGSSERLFFLLSLEVLRCFSFSIFSTSSSSFVCPFSWLSPGTTWGGITHENRTFKTQTKTCRTFILTLFSSVTFP